MTSTRGAVLFTDLVGFTEYTELSGDDAAIEVLDQQIDMVDPVVQEHPGARVVKELGDGMLLWFSDASHGVDGAVTLLSVMGQAHERGNFPLQVRMGLHAGEVSRRGDDLIGGTVNLASRIAAIAGPGELLVSGEVSRSCPAPFLRPIGPTRVRGVREPVWLHRVLADPRRADRSA